MTVRVHDWAAFALGMGGLCAAAVGSFGHVVAGARVMLLANLFALGLALSRVRQTERAT